MSKLDSTNEFWELNFWESICIGWLVYPREVENRFTNKSVKVKVIEERE